MDNKLAAIGMAVTLGIGAWIAQPHSHGADPSPDWTLGVETTGVTNKPADVACVWIKDKDDLTSQMKVVRADVSHNVKIKLGRARQIAVQCENVDSLSKEVISIGLCKNDEKMCEGAANQPDLDQPNYDQYARIERQ